MYQFYYKFQIFVHRCFCMFQVETRDALLHAIDEEYVEAVEVLLEHEEMKHKEGELHVCLDISLSQ